MSKFCSLYKIVFLFPLVVLGNYSFNKVDGKNGEGSGPIIHWENPEIDMELAYGSFPLSLRTYVPNAVVNGMNQWSLIDGTLVQFTFTGCDSTGADSNDGTNTIVYVTENWPVEKSALAITKTYYISDPSFNEGAVIDADILVNGQYHAFGKGETSLFDIQSVITHEMGHVLGLGHEVSPINYKATMYANIAVGETFKRALGDNDKAAVTDTYPNQVTKIKFAASDKCRGDILKFNDIKKNNRAGCSIGSISRDQDPPIDMGLFALCLIPVFLFLRRYRA